MPEIKIILLDDVDDGLVENITQAIHDALNDTTQPDDDGEERLLQFKSVPGADEFTLHLEISDKEEEEDE